MSYGLPWSLSAAQVSSSYATIPARELEAPDEYSREPRHGQMSYYMRTLLGLLAQAGDKCDLATIHQEFLARTGRKQLDDADKIVTTAIAKGMVYYAEDLTYRLTRAGKAAGLRNSSNSV